MAADQGHSELEVKAVVLDTSMYKEGRLNMGALTGLAERLKHRMIPVWVPTQVIWEWAAHAADDAAGLDVGSRAAKKLDRAGYPVGPRPAPGWPPRATPGEIADHICEALMEQIEDIDNVTVIPPRGESAVAAIRDQIMGTGPGSVRSSVRTGAADSAWVRDTVAYGRDQGITPQVLVFVTGNRQDVSKTLNALGYTDNDAIRTPSSENVLVREVLLAAAPASAAVTRTLSTHFMEYESFPGADPSWNRLISDISVSDLRSVDEYGQLDGLDQITEIDIWPHAVLVGLLNLDVDDVEFFDEGRRAYASFTVALLVSVTVHGFSLDNNGSVVMDARDLHKVLISAPCAAVTDGDDVVEEVRQADTAGVLSAEERFGDSYEGFLWLLDFLEALTGVAVDIDRQSLRERSFPENFVVRGVTSESDIEAEVDQGLPDDADAVEWRVTFGDAGASVICQYDPNSRVWLGRDDSFDWQQPYFLSSEGLRNHGEPMSAIAQVWAALTNP